MDGLIYVRFFFGVVIILDVYETLLRFDEYLCEGVGTLYFFDDEEIS